MATPILPNNSGTATTPSAIRQAVRGPIDVYVDDFVSFGSGNPAGAFFDWHPVFQAAHDAVAAQVITAAGNGQVASGTVRIRNRALPYTVGGTTWIWSQYVSFLGEGDGVQIVSGQLAGNLCCPIFAMGWRTPQSCGGTFLSNWANYRPDAVNKLDSSLAPSAGIRWGFRGFNQAFLWSHGTPFSHGSTSPSLGYPYPDFWAETNKITIEFCAEGHASNYLAPNDQIFGSSDANQKAAPFWLNMFNEASPARFNLYYMTQPARFAPPVAHSVPFGQVAGGGMQKVAIQIDLVGATHTVWINGIQVFTGATGTPAGSMFNENDWFPFCMGVAGTYGIFQATPSDFGLFGFSMSKTLRYNVSTNGSTQTRVSDSKTFTQINDSYRYNDDGTDRGDGGRSSGIVAYMNFTENPTTTLAQSNMILGASGQGCSTPVFIGHSSQNVGGIIGQNLSNMQLRCYYPYSAPVMTAQVLSTRFENLYLNGGMWAYATGMSGASYMIDFNQCRFSSPCDAAVYALFSIQTFTDSKIFNGGRANFRFVQGDTTFAGHTFMAGCNANCQFSIMRTHIGGQDGGGSFTVRDINQDTENAPFASRCAIMIDRNHGSEVILADISCAQIPGKPTIILDDFQAGGALADCYITVERVTSAFSSQPCYVQVTGNQWYGQIDDLLFGQAQPIDCLGTFGAGSNLKITSLGFPAPPHGGTWYAGIADLKVTNPADGLPRRYTCSRTGTQGSTTPSSWIGLEAFRSSPQALSAYAVDHTVIATTAYGGSAFGWFGDDLTRDALALLFGQSAGFGMPGTLKFRLVLTPPFKGSAANILGGASEPTTGNYAPVTVTNNLTNFPASVAGVKSNGVAITWPTLTVAIPNVAGVMVTDSGGGRLLAYVQFTTPHTFGVGVTPTIGIGALTFTQTPTNTLGTLSQYGWGKIVDRYFGGVDITPPATWYLGVNTAHAAPGTAPTEPSGNSYARAGLTNDTTHWGPKPPTAYVATQNLVSPTFATPTGAGWGTALGIPVFDAATAGNCWWTADAPSLYGTQNSVVCSAGSPPTVGIGSLLLTI
jgi:hypothetical protein